MKKLSLAVLLLTTCYGAAYAQDRIYRCGNEYINNASVAKQRGCKAVEGGNVTVIRNSGVSASPPRASSSGSRSGSSAPRASAPSTAGTPANAPRVNQTTQAARDNDARAILQAELRKSEEKLSNLKAEYNDGNPVKSALELRNPQGYIERTANLKADIERTEADIEGIRREISRLR